MKIITIDLEDWFHILDHDETAGPQQWEKFESRVERNTDRILEWLNRSGHKATFFCLGWIAARHPKLIRKIAAEGHEIGCHSMNHQLVYKQSRDLFSDDLIESIKGLEDILGKKVKTYRAPGFSVTEKTRWVFDVLLECGIENDCSVFPASRNHGGFPDFRQRQPCQIEVKGKLLKEFPMSMASFPFGNIVFSGGGYFRLLPYPAIKLLMKRSEYVMTYFHPRDFDHDQPVISSLPLKRRLMSYIGLKTAGKKFEMLLQDFQFINVERAAAEIDWTGAPVVVFD
ncbi:MAG: polysaccharide deacetylase family protein [Bacteroidetes bacterium]|nr:polysaccharide deacetylase family protein [Bacteroidota bacterium]